MDTTRDELATARRLAARAATLAMLGVSTEAGVASLADAAGKSPTDLRRARTFLDFGAPRTGTIRQRAEELLDAAVERPVSLTLAA